VQGAVERPGLQRDRPLAAGLGLLDDGVTVSLARGEGEEDLELDGTEREALVGGGEAWRHGGNYVRGAHRFQEGCYGDGGSANDGVGEFDPVCALSPREALNPTFPACDRDSTTDRS